MTTSSDTLAEDDSLLQLVYPLAVVGFGIKWAAIAARVSRMLAQLSGQDVPGGRHRQKSTARHHESANMSNSSREIDWEGEKLKSPCIHATRVHKSLSSHSLFT
jgi:hypothetical protein